MNYLKKYLKKTYPFSVLFQMRDDTLKLKEKNQILEKKFDTIQRKTDELSIQGADLLHEIQKIETTFIEIRDKVDEIEKTILCLQNSINEEKDIAQNRNSDIEENIRKINDECTLLQKNVLTNYTQVNNRIVKIRKDLDYQYYIALSPVYYEAALIDWYHERTGDWLDLNNPQLFNEKIQWLKLYDCTEKKTILSDKYLVKKEISDRIGKEYVIPLLGVWNKFDEIEFDKLPNQFVLKANHGSGLNVIVRDKSALDYKDVSKKFNGWMNKNYAFQIGFELQYMNIERKIIAEPYIGEIDSNVLDYRFFCFDGVPTYIWVDSESGTPNHKRNIYDINWNMQDYNVNYPHIEEEVCCPEKLNEMISLAQKLSEGFAFVRVDFYYINNIIYFGELTFTPQSGIGKWDDPMQNLHYGELIKLPPRKSLPQRRNYV